MMVQNTRKPVIDFTSYIKERTADFTGREWVFQAINAWLADPDGSRFFLLTGEPGSGKTAIASRLAQFSQGAVRPPKGLTCLIPHFLSGIHFCAAADALWIDPFVFASALATQLANRYPSYLRALEDLSDQHIQIEVKQDVQTVVNGQVIGVIINVSAPSPENAFNRVVREPIEALLQEVRDEQIVILVDALDEALSYSGMPTIVSLLAQTASLSPRVRFLLTSRQDARVQNSFREGDELALSAAKFDQYNQDDIRRYVNGRLREDKELIRRALLVGPEHINEIIEIVPRKAEGNFQYTRFLLDAMTSNLRSLMELEGLPEGLDGLYFDSLERVIKLGKRDWINEYAPLLGVFSVAQESLTSTQLQALTGQSGTSVWQYLSDLQQFIEEIKPIDGKEEEEARYRLFHQSVIDFLRSQSIFVKKKKLRNSFYLPEREWHKHLANVCACNGLAIIWQDIKLNPPEQQRRAYARQYYIMHLYQAGEWRQLFAVLDEGIYEREKMRYERGTRSSIQDLALGQQAAAWDGWTMEEGVKLLPTLWRYILLRCSLNSRTDKYPLSAFRLLVSLKREKEALDLAELLTKPSFKANVLLGIAKQLRKQGMEQESLQVLVKSCDIVPSIRVG